MGGAASLRAFPKPTRRKFSTNLGAVAFGYHHSICRNMTLRYSAHAKIYTFTATKEFTGF